MSFVSLKGARLALASGALLGMASSVWSLSSALAKVPSPAV